MSIFSTISDGFTAVAKEAKSVQQQIKSLFNKNDSKPTFDSGKYVKQKYNEIYHNVELYLDNSGDFTKPKRYYINPAAVLGLQITDTVNDWVVDGSITFMYLPEGPPPESNSTGQNKSTPTSGMEKAAAENGETLNSYTFRGDGFDLLRVMIIPESTAGPDGQGLKIDNNNTKWMLSYIFSIYDIEDVNDLPELQGDTASYMKCLRLKFHDVRYQILQTTNIEYSTAMPKDATLKPNFESDIGKKIGVLYTGDILRDILNEVLAKPENGGCKEFEIPITKWNKGKGELFYTSPAQYSVEDDLDYILSHHVSDTQLKGLEGGTDIAEINDMCLLHTERADTFGKIETLSLTPLADFFKKAGKEQNAPGELQKEHFFVTAVTEQKDSAASVYRAPMGPPSSDMDLKTNKYGQIISYSFVDMSPTVNSNMLCTTPVYSVDVGKRQFNVEFKSNDINSVRKIISKSYISELYKEGSDEEKLFLPVINKNKKDLNVFPTFSLNGTNPIARQRNGLHNLIYTGLFQNACICFKVYGLTWRESGTFIGIDKTTGSADNDYNNKLYGQWFVVKVDHLFEAGAYVNVIYAVKLHRYKELKVNFENTI